MPAPNGGTSRLPSGGIADRARLLAALAASVLLHAVLALAPAGGGPQGTAAGVAEGGEAPRHLVVTFGPAPTRIPAWSGAMPVAPAGEAAAPGAGHPREPAPGRELALAEGGPWFETRELDKRPQPLAEVDLDPVTLRGVAAAGRVRVTLWIDDRGRVADVAIGGSEVPGAFLQPIADAFRRARFTPGERYGRAVGTVMRLEVDYQDSRVAGPRHRP